MHGSPRHLRPANASLEHRSPAHVNEDEQKDGNRQKMRNKVQAKVQGCLSRRSFITSQKTLKAKKKKRESGTKMKDGSCFTQPSNQPEKKDQHFGYKRM